MIAQEIGVHLSTISRELNRNTAQKGRIAGEYLAENTHRKTNHAISLSLKRSQVYPLNEKTRGKIA
jgi:IS30 family transposase